MNKTLVRLLYEHTDGAVARLTDIFGRPEISEDARGVILDRVFARWERSDAPSIIEGADGNTAIHGLAPARTTGNTEILNFQAYLRASLISEFFRILQRARKHVSDLTPDDLMFDAQGDRRPLLEIFRSKLTPKHREHLDEYLLGKTLHETADSLGTSYGTANRIRAELFRIAGEEK